MITTPTADAVTRDVRTGSRDDTPTRIVVARRTYRSDPADLWDALTDPDRIPRWFLPVSGDLSVGGRYQLEGNAGGVVERCDQPESFAVTWEIGDMVSWLSVGLAPVDGGTELELVHEAPIDLDMWEQFGPGAVGVGWDLGLVGLAMHLDTGEPVDPELAATFHRTEDGRVFIEQAARDWGRAAARDGDDPDAADSAAERTIGFYTIEPEDGAAPDPGH